MVATTVCAVWARLLCGVRQDPKARWLPAEGCERGNRRRCLRGHRCVGSERVIRILYVYFFKNWTLNTQYLHLIDPYQLKVFGLVSCSEVVIGSFNFVDSLYYAVLRCKWVPFCPIFNTPFIEVSSPFTHTPTHRWSKFDTPSVWWKHYRRHGDQIHWSEDRLHLEQFWLKYIWRWECRLWGKQHWQFASLACFIFRYFQ